MEVAVDCTWVGDGCGAVVVPVGVAPVVTGVDAGVGASFAFVDAGVDVSGPERVLLALGYARMWPSELAGWLEESEGVILLGGAGCSRSLGLRGRGLLCYLIELGLRNWLGRRGLYCWYPGGLELGPELPVRGRTLPGVAGPADQLEIPLLVRSALGHGVLVVDVHQVYPGLPAAIHAFASLALEDLLLEFRREALTPSLEFVKRVHALTLFRCVVMIRSSSGFSLTSG